MGWGWGLLGSKQLPCKALSFCHRYYAKAIKRRGCFARGHGGGCLSVVATPWAGGVCCLQIVRWGGTVAEAGWLDLCDNKRHSNCWIGHPYDLQYNPRVWQHQAPSQMTLFVPGTIHTSPLLPVSSAQTQYRTHSKLLAQDAAELFLDVLPQVPKAPQLLRPLEHPARC